MASTELGKRPNETKKGLEKIIDTHSTETVTPDGKVERIQLPNTIRDKLIKWLRSQQIGKGVKSSLLSDNIMLQLQPPQQVPKSNPEPLESVFGQDTRIRIIDTTSFPFRAVGLVGFESGGCTGTLIGKRYVLTAGHCIFNIENNKWYKNVKFWAGRNGNEAPFGAVGWVRLLSTKGWTVDHDDNSDFGLVILDRDLGTAVGWLGYGYEEPMHLYNINILGYPGDKPSGTMWHSFCPLLEASTLTLRYNCATAPGESGSAIFVYWANANKYQIFGVNAYEYKNKNAPNYGPRINKLRYELIKSWTASY
jgi:glutamyl endopeptidase